MTALKSAYGAYNTGKFWIVATAISAGSAIMLSNEASSFGDLATPANSLITVLVLAIAAFGVCLLPFAIWQHITRKRFFAWLDEQRMSLDRGAVHADGYTINLDTELVRYQVVFSAFFATVSFSSKPYVLQHRTAGVAQASFTAFTLLFGWWFIGLEGVVETLKALAGNLRSSETFTLRELLLQRESL